MYLTYEEYKELGGELSEAEFDKFADEAEMKVSAESFKRIYNVDDETCSVVKKCILKVIGLMKKRDDVLSSGIVSSFSHDGLSQSLSVPKAEEYLKEISGIIRTYLSQQTNLSGTPLLYLGVSDYD